MLILVLHNYSQIKSFQPIIKKQAPKVLKEMTENFVFVLASLGIVYGCLCYIFLDMNPTNWWFFTHIIGRIITVLFVIGYFTLIGFLMIILKKKKGIIPFVYYSYVNWFCSITCISSTKKRRVLKYPFYSLLVMKK